MNKYSFIRISADIPIKSIGEDQLSCVHFKHKNVHHRKTKLKIIFNKYSKLYYMC